jgi:hypothetical protein
MEDVNFTLRQTKSQGHALRHSKPEHFILSGVRQVKKLALVETNWGWGDDKIRIEGDRS